MKTEQYIRLISDDANCVRWLFTQAIQKEQYRVQRVAFLALAAVVSLVNGVGYCLVMGKRSVTTLFLSRSLCEVRLAVAEERCKSFHSFQFAASITLLLVLSLLRMRSLTPEDPPPPRVRDQIPSTPYRVSPTLPPSFIGSLGQDSLQQEDLEGDKEVGLKQAVQSFCNDYHQFQWERNPLVANRTARCRNHMNQILTHRRKDIEDYCETIGTVSAGSDSNRNCQRLVSMVYRDGRITIAGDEGNYVAFVATLREAANDLFSPGQHWFCREFIARICYYRFAKVSIDPYRRAFSQAPPLMGVDSPWDLSPQYAIFNAQAGGFEGLVPYVDEELTIGSSKLSLLCPENILLPDAVFPADYQGFLLEARRRNYGICHVVIQKQDSQIRERCSGELTPHQKDRIYTISIAIKESPDRKGVRSLQRYRKDFINRLFDASGVGVMSISPAIQKALFLSTEVVSKWLDAVPKIECSSVQVEEEEDWEQVSEEGEQIDLETQQAYTLLWSAHIIWILRERLEFQFLKIWHEECVEQGSLFQIVLQLYHHYLARDLSEESIKKLQMEIKQGVRGFGAWNKPLEALLRFFQNQCGRGGRGSCFPALAQGLETVLPIGSTASTLEEYKNFLQTLQQRSEWRTSADCFRNGIVQWGYRSDFFEGDIPKTEKIQHQFLADLARDVLLLGERTFSVRDYRDAREFAEKGCQNVREYLEQAAIEESSIWKIMALCTQAAEAASLEYVRRVFCNTALGIDLLSGDMEGDAPRSPYTLKISGENGQVQIERWRLFKITIADSQQPVAFVAVTLHMPDHRVDHVSIRFSVSLSKELGTPSS